MSCRAIGGRIDAPFWKGADQNCRPSSRINRRAAAPKQLKSLTGKERYGAQGRDRTTDTAIFNRMLYQLSYLGAEPRTGRIKVSGGVIEAPWRPV